MTQLSPYQLADTNQVVTSGEHVYQIRRMYDVAPDDRPREKLIKHGPDTLNSRELLEAVIGTGTKKEDVRSLAHRLFREYGEHTLAYERSVTRLRDELDVPESKACQIVAAFELGRRFFDRGTGRAITIRTPEQVYEHVKEMGRLEKEHLRALYLNNHYRLIHDEVISIGSQNAHLVHPREVFRPAVEYAASAVVLVHNHPSGNTLPSPEDEAVTKQLISAGELLGIELLDHVIVTSTGFGSICNK